MQRGHGRWAGVQRGRGRGVLTRVIAGSGVIRRARRAARVGRGRGCRTEVLFKGRWGLLLPAKTDRLHTSQTRLPDIPGVCGHGGSERAQNTGGPEKPVCLIVWEINDFNN